jgi:hypothetical protein
VKANQVHLIAAAMFRRLEQILHALESRFARQIVGDVVDVHRLDRVDDDVAVVHLVAAADFHLLAGPDPDGAADPAAPDAFAKAFGEDHQRPIDSSWRR